MGRIEAAGIINEKETSLVLFSLEHRLANVFSKRSDSKYPQLVSIFSFVGQTVSVATTQLRHCSAKATTDRTLTNRHGCAPTDLYLQ